MSCGEVRRLVLARLSHAEDQSQLPPGPFVVGRAQPAWIRDLHDPDRCEREWLLDHGIG